MMGNVPPGKDELGSKKKPTHLKVSIDTYRWEARVYGVAQNLPSSFLEAKSWKWKATVFFGVPQRCEHACRVYFFPSRPATSSSCIQEVNETSGSMAPNAQARERGRERGRRRQASKRTDRGGRRAAEPRAETSFIVLFPQRRAMSDFKPAWAAASLTTALGPKGGDGGGGGCLLS